MFHTVVEGVVVAVAKRKCTQTADEPTPNTLSVYTGSDSMHHS